MLEYPSDINLKNLDLLKHINFLFNGGLITNNENLYF